MPANSKKSNVLAMTGMPQRLICRSEEVSHIAAIHFEIDKRARTKIRHRPHSEIRKNTVSTPTERRFTKEPLVRASS